MNFYDENRCKRLAVAQDDVTLNYVFFRHHHPRPFEGILLSSFLNVLCFLSTLISRDCRKIQPPGSAEIMRSSTPIFQYNFDSSFISFQCCFHYITFSATSFSRIKCLTLSLSLIIDKYLYENIYFFKLNTRN